MRVWKYLDLVAFLAANLVALVASLDSTYHNYTELTSYLHNVHQQYPNITYLYSIGKSVEGRELWVLALGESPRDHVLLRPDVKYVGNMHGNEVVGRELLLHFIERLVTEYGQNETVTTFLRTTRLHVLVTMNPDGFEQASRTLSGHCAGTYGRFNAHDVDLNRNFPDSLLRHQQKREPETEAVMDWLRAYQFVLSANLHGGALLVNYPYDNYKGSSTDWLARYSEAPDDDLFRHLAHLYSNTHPTMHYGEPCEVFPGNFPGGIVNGAQWYVIRGGMQDYNLFYGGCFEFTFELSCCKFPPASDLPKMWEENREALLVFISQGHIGVKGLVRSEEGQAIKGARITILGREDYWSETTPYGEYWRLLLAGNYTLQVDAARFEAKSVNFRVVEGQVSRVDVILRERPYSFKESLNCSEQTNLRYPPTTASDIPHGLHTHPTIYSGGCTSIKLLRGVLFLLEVLFIPFIVF